MADVTYLCLHDHDDDPRLPEQTLTLDSIPYWSHHDFDFYASDPEFASSDHSLRVHIASHEDDDDGHFAEQFESNICVRGGDDFSDHGSILSNDLLDRENQVNFVMDLFQQRVEQSQVMDHRDLVSEALNDSTFGVIEGHSDVGIDGLGLDLGLGLGFGFERVSLHDDTRGFIVESHGSAGDCDDEDDFFIGRRPSGSASGEAPSTASGIQPFEDIARPVGFESDSDEEENDVLGVCVHSEDDYNVHEDNEDLASIPLCWDALHLEDNRDNIEDFEWEEVDGRVDEREVLSTFTAEDDRSISVLVSSITGIEEEVTDGTVGGMGNLEWEVLLNADNLDTNPDLSHDGEPFFGEHDDYMYTAEYEMMFGQFGENENPLMGRPPASASVVQNLPSVILTKEDVEINNALCAVCKDDFSVGEQVKQLPCLHRYHGDCITPWLGIRNTCPVCRYECPTDDADYERRRTQRSGRRTDGD